MILSLQVNLVSHPTNPDYFLTGSLTAFWIVSPNSLGISGLAHPNILSFQVFFPQSKAHLSLCNGPFLGNKPFPFLAGSVGNLDFSHTLSASFPPSTSLPFLVFADRVSTCLSISFRKVFPSTGSCLLSPPPPLAIPPLTFQFAFGLNRKSTQFFLESPKVSLILGTFQPSPLFSSPLGDGRFVTNDDEGWCTGRCYDPFRSRSSTLFRSSLSFPVAFLRTRLTLATLLGSTFMTYGPPSNTPTDHTLSPATPFSYLPSAVVGWSLPCTGTDQFPSQPRSYRY